MYTYLYNFQVYRNRYDTDKKYSKLCVYWSKLKSDGETFSIVIKTKKSNQTNFLSILLFARLKLLYFKINYLINYFNYN